MSKLTVTDFKTKNRDHPIGYDIFVFLRRKVFNNCIDDNGYVYKSIVAKVFKITQKEVDKVIIEYNTSDDIQPGHMIYYNEDKSKIRVKTGHSIPKVDERKFLSIVELKENMKGYCYIKTKSKYEYTEGNSFKPRKRNCCVLQPVDNKSIYSNSNFHTKLEFDLYSLVTETGVDILTLTGEPYYYRGEIPAKYIKYIPL